MFILYLKKKKWTGKLVMISDGVTMMELKEHMPIHLPLYLHDIP